MAWREFFHQQSINEAEIRQEKSNSFTHRLFKGSPWFFSKLSTTESSNPIEVEKRVKTSTTGEKLGALKNLETFAQVGTSETGKIEFPGGEILTKEAAAVTLVAKSNSDKKISIELSEESLSNVEVFFYGEPPKDYVENEENDLLSKMIQAMKLEKGSYVRGFLSKNNYESFPQLLSEILDCNPKYIISLGAVATNQLLGRKERLSKVHGEFFPVKISRNDDKPKTFEVVPVFHPDLLQINPNMKRSAWLDLQKVLKSLGKI